MQRRWEPQWDAYKAAEADYQALVEECKKKPADDKQSHAQVLAAGRKRFEAWFDFSEAFDAEHYRA